MTSTGFRLVYTVTEAGQLLGLSRSTAYHLVGTGELPTIRLGRRVVVTRPALTALLGMEPPLPHELEHARRSPAAPTPAPRPQRAAGRQPDLPFNG